jgi:D-aminoacyl-tRNA deacylase
MRCVIQRVDAASVVAEGKKTGEIGEGLLIYAAMAGEDTEETVFRMASRIVRMRIFPDETDRMNLSLLDKGYGCLLVSQFTLYADCKKGNRPFYGKAASPDKALRLYQAFEKELNTYCACASGIFGASMLVQSSNNGPVTIILDS